MRLVRALPTFVSLVSILFTTTVSGASGTPHLFDGLGNHGRTLSGCNTAAQPWFNQGLAFMFAFNHDESIRSFEEAATLDPDCAMAWWGIAIANGPHINNPFVPADHTQAALSALRRADQLRASASPVDQALIAAQATRFATDSDGDRAPLDLAYAQAMAGVWFRFPDDPDVGALYAEAMADLHPWDLWTADGTAKAATLEIVAVLDRVLQLDPDHPLANHLYIHALEASGHPGQARAAADRLRNLQPALGHMVHMPSHIDVKTGQWAQAVTANSLAIAADDAYAARAPEPGFYRIYMAHNHHMLSFAAMMSGRSREALDAIRSLTDNIPERFLRENPPADGFMVMPMEVLMRFGRWDDILATPEYPDYLPLSRALRHYARGVAYAALGKSESAQDEQRAFMDARQSVPMDLPFGNNPAHALLDIAQALMQGEILYRVGRKEDGLESLRDAVRKEDALTYDEPPGWIQPVRHALGAALLQSGKYAEAESVFRADQVRWPGNGWSLYGLSRALELQGHKAEAAEAMHAFDAVWSKADTAIKSPCLCFPGV
ncbi:MAG: hypothetical protein H6993_09850 [Pseudomonadales bacterium]|nr:hypothetical protein [Pseudomonadales bacterium]MCP5184255.1 hypothetical protein [Pseudomonadales bacterium]